jgi:hypothetical protein
LGNTVDTLVLELTDGPLSASFFRCVLATMCALSPLCN